MNPYRQSEVDPEEILLRPRSRWPLRIAIAVTVVFVAFVYYGMFEAFGWGALIVVPGPLGLLIANVARIKRENDPQTIAARAASIELRAERQLSDPSASWPRSSPPAL